MLNRVNSHGSQLELCCATDATAQLHARNAVAEHPDSRGTAESRAPASGCSIESGNLRAGPGGRLPHAADHPRPTATASVPQRQIVHQPVDERAAWSAHLAAAEPAARADDVLRDAGLGSAAGRRVGGSSRGMLQRLGLAAPWSVTPNCCHSTSPPPRSIRPGGARFWTSSPTGAARPPWCCPAASSPTSMKSATPRCAS